MHCYAMRFMIRNWNLKGMKICYIYLQVTEFGNERNKTKVIKGH